MTETMFGEKNYFCCSWGWSESSPLCHEWLWVHLWLDSGWWTPGSPLWWTGLAEGWGESAPLLHIPPTKWNGKNYNKITISYYLTSRNIFQSKLKINKSSNFHNFPSFPSDLIQLLKSIYLFIIKSNVSYFTIDVSCYLIWPNMIQ